eukprot:CAMPEP_0119141528 /NCGR_PEP_ID=MMETSP1310-20130426/31190_1 /TAXON_ID=464262 /ORGANISM="Genus nov. species nov., Strain RCC2339" /LENGTH=76 /DNA_ID=CAMNT_0007132981 /DNA_START=194 /DNA_END=420 /DNA_ORIENTATION=+
MCAAIGSVSTTAKRTYSRSKAPRASPSNGVEEGDPRDPPCRAPAAGRIANEKSSSRLAVRRSASCSLISSCDAPVA